jgi:DNA polymerase III subunit chi
MTRVDFYVLQAESELERFHFAAKLCDKAFKQGLKVMLLAADDQAAQQASELLWHFRPESFLPHTSAELTDSHTPIVISSGVDDSQQRGLLINLGFDTPSMFSRFDRVAEIVAQTAKTLESTRRNFAYYKARGYPVHTHKLS